MVNCLRSVRRKTRNNFASHNILHTFSGKTSDFGNFFGDVFLVKRVFDYNLKALVVEEEKKKKKGSGMRI